MKYVILESRVSSEEEIVVCSSKAHGARVLACEALHAEPGAGLALGGLLGGDAAVHEACAVRSREPCELRSRTLESPAEAGHGSAVSQEASGW